MLPNIESTVRSSPTTFLQSFATFTVLPSQYPFLHTSPTRNHSMSCLDQLRSSLKRQIGRVFPSKGHSSRGPRRFEIVSQCLRSRISSLIWTTLGRAYSGYFQKGRNSVRKRSCALWEKVCIILPSHMISSRRAVPADEASDSMIGEKYIGSNVALIERPHLLDRQYSTGSRDGLAA